MKKLSISSLRSPLKNMAEPKNTINGLLTTDETDILMTTSKFSRADEDALSTKDENDDRDENEIPNAQKSPKANLKEDKPETSISKNNRVRKRPRKDSNRTPSSDGKRVRLNEDRKRAPFQKRMKASKYSPWANIAPTKTLKMTSARSERKLSTLMYEGW